MPSSFNLVIGLHAKAPQRNRAPYLPVESRPGDAASARAVLPLVQAPATRQGIDHDERAETSSRPNMGPHRAPRGRRPCDGLVLPFRQRSQERRTARDVARVHAVDAAMVGARAGGLPPAFPAALSPHLAGRLGLNRRAENYRPSSGWQVHPAITVTLPRARQCAHAHCSRPPRDLPARLTAQRHANLDGRGGLDAEIGPARQARHLLGLRHAGAADHAHLCARAMHNRDQRERPLHQRTFATCGRRRT